MSEIDLPQTHAAQTRADGAVSAGHADHDNHIDSATANVDPATANGASSSTSSTETDNPSGVTERTWLARGLSGVASGLANTGRKISDLSRSRPSLPQIRGNMPDPPYGARQVSHGYVDDLWQARPTLDRPYPIILVHGTISSKNVWQNLTLRLREDNFVVFCPDYGVHGTQDIPTSAGDVGAYIEQVLAATGAEQVDIVGHSQGGLLARYWINELGGEDYVHHLVSVASPHQGTTLEGVLGSFMRSDMTQRVAAATVRRVFGAAGMQQVVGSPVMETLAASPETRPFIRYTNFATRNDSTVVPHDHAFLAESEEALVKNYYLQDLGIGKCRHEELPSREDVGAILHDTLLAGLTEEANDALEAEIAAEDDFDDD